MPSPYELTAIRLHTSDNRTDTYGIARTRGGAHFVMHIAARVPFCKKGHVDDKRLLVAFLKNTGGEHGFCRICAGKKLKVEGTLVEEVKEHIARDFAGLSDKMKGDLLHKIKDALHKQTLLMNIAALDKISDARRLSDDEKITLTLGYLGTILIRHDEIFESAGGEFLHAKDGGESAIAPIIDHFQQITPPPSTVEVRAIPAWGPNESGLFAKSSVDKDTILGTYSGLVIEAMDAPAYGNKKSDYIFVFYPFKDNYKGYDYHYGHLSVDASRVVTGSGIPSEQITWQGRINHKWSWHTVLTLSKFNISMPDQWKMAFSNVSVDGYTGELRTTRRVEKDEQLFIDYGLQYWTKDKPIWALADIDATLFNFVQRMEIPSFWKNKNVHVVNQILYTLKMLRDKSVIK